jgi:hypothetical protein
VLAGAGFAAFKIHHALKGNPKPDTGAATLHLPTSFAGFAVAKDSDSATLRARLTAGSTSSTARAEPVYKPSYTSTRAGTASSL